MIAVATCNLRPRHTCEAYPPSNRPQILRVYYELVTSHDSGGFKSQTYGCEKYERTPSSVGVRATIKLERSTFPIAVQLVINTKAQKVR